jgi:hypothetical protein
VLRKGGKKPRKKKKGQRRPIKKKGGLKIFWINSTDFYWIHFWEFSVQKIV